MCDYVVSEYDYSQRDVRRRLGVADRDAWLTMIFDGRWQCVFTKDFRPMLHDLKQDPKELTDLGGGPAYEAERERLERLFFDWTRRIAQRMTISDAIIAAGDPRLDEARAGILIGFRNEV